MQSRFFIVVMTMAFTIAAGTSAEAQVRSKSAQVTLIARMPETLAFAVNGAGQPSESLAFKPRSGAQVAISITTSWVLARGRAGMATLARVKRPPSPVLLAFSSAGTADAFQNFHLPSPKPKVEEVASRLDSFAITNLNRNATSTISLSDSVAPGDPSQSPQDGYIGTMKIQVQAVP